MGTSVKSRKSMSAPMGLTTARRTPTVSTKPGASGADAWTDGKETAWFATK